ncbi:MAG: MarR family transcriptional regulator [Methanoregula sp.]
MRTESVVYFTEREEELVNLLKNGGMNTYVARLLIFLDKVPEATTHEIERGTDLRQSQVSNSTQYLVDLGWISYRESKSPNKGRPIKIYTLITPVEEIIGAIGKEKIKDVTNQLTRAEKLRNYG